MKVELSREEAKLIQFAIVRVDELWKPCGGVYVPKNETVERILNKMVEVQEAKKREA